MFSFWIILEFSFYDISKETVSLQYHSLHLPSKSFSELRILIRAINESKYVIFYSQYVSVYIACHTGSVWLGHIKFNFARSSRSCLKHQFIMQKKTHNKKQLENNKL